MTRQDQIELMKECLEDAAVVLKPYKPNYAFHEKATLAAAFFGYRVGPHLPRSSTQSLPVK